MSKLFHCLHYYYLHLNPLLSHLDYCIGFLTVSLYEASLKVSSCWTAITLLQVILISIQFKKQLSNTAFLFLTSLKLGILPLILISILPLLQLTTWNILSAPWNNSWQKLTYIALKSYSYYLSSIYVLLYESRVICVHLISSTKL